MADQDSLRKNAIGVFRLLREFATLRRRPVLEIGDYEDHLWLADVPTSPVSFCRLSPDDREADEDLWLEVEKLPEPVCPQPPEGCRDWVAEQFPYSDDEAPTLRSRIPVSNTGGERDQLRRAGGDSDWLELSDHPDLASCWDRFLEERWLPWAGKHTAWRRHHVLYSTLFAMRQTLLRAGEQYELLLCFGLLTAELEGKKRVRRHLLTLRAALEFESTTGTLSIRAPLDGVRPALEADMLPGELRPSPNVERSFERDVAPRLEADPWDRPVAEGFLRSVANSQARGAYSGGAVPEEHAQGPFNIALAPAIVLRKRTTRGMVAAFEKIVEQLETGGPFPSSVGLIAGAGRESAVGEIGGSGQSGEDAGRVYFPRPTNLQQSEIVQRLAKGHGLLVQGPPGTGKSHAIGNLISHLLALGQRVLVTAETPRALRVLSEKIPEAIRPLCVSLLGSDRQSQDALKGSVAGIAGRLQRWDAKQSKVTIAALETKFERCVAERAEVDSRLRSLREAETKHHEIADGRYRGSAQRIAELLRQQEPDLGWIRDEVDFLVKPPLTNSEFGMLVKLVRKLPDETLAELGLDLPSDRQLLPPIQELIRLFGAERRAQSAIDELTSGDACRGFEAIGRAPAGQVSRLGVALEDLNRSRETAFKRPLPWVSNALYEVLAGDDRPWTVLRDVTARPLEGLRAKVQKADRRQVRLPGGVDTVAVLADATDLLRHVEAGGSVGLVPRIFNRLVRRTRYIQKGAAVDGRKCSDAETLRQLLEHLQTERSLDDAWKHWNGFCERPRATLTLQLARLEENLEALGQVLQAHRSLERAKQAVQAIGGLADPAWHDHEAVQALRRCCEGRLAESELESVTGQLREIESGLTAFRASPKAHPVVGRLCEAIRARSEDDLVAAKGRLLELIEDTKARNRYVELAGALGKAAPATLAGLRESSDAKEWDERATLFEDAWHWAQAQGWLLAARDEQSLGQLSERYRSLQADADTTMEQMASERAWMFCLQRMEEKHRQHLVAWQQAIRRLGKGTGRHAATYRRDAQENMDRCRETIPAWVLPLFQIFETVRPEPAMFDVVIVDEASQCSLDALILLYIGKKVIIVGDDEQISPSDIGLKVADFRALTRKHLPGFPLADVFTPGQSLFGIGQIWYPDRIVLREHFRCMPEIIRFSNDLCYQDTPLVPLRQYPPDRLEPVCDVLVPEGCQRGRSSTAVNQGEAEAIVAKIEECCRDKSYDGKTMGVVGLLGSAQAKKIESMLLDRLGPEEIEARRIVCGDSYSFQGDERDVMFLSLVSAASDESGTPVRSQARTQKRDKQRFNVAVSRAKDQLWLFHSMGLGDLSNPQDLRRQLVEFSVNRGRVQASCSGIDPERLLRWADDPMQRVGASPKPFDSWFEVDVYLRICARRFRVWPQFEVAGRLIDLVVEDGSRRLAVECDGDQWHGPEAYQSDIDRQRQLERAGWTFWRVRGSEFYANKQKALEDLWNTLDKMGIQPIARVQTDAEDGLGGGGAAGAHGVVTAVDGIPQSGGLRGLAAGYEDPPDPLSWAPEKDDEGPRVAEAPTKSTETLGPDCAGDDGGGAEEKVETSLPSHRTKIGWGPGPDRSWKLAISPKPYSSWEGSGLPDPNSDDRRGIERGLLGIVEVEGPIVIDRLIHTYTNGAGLRRSGRQIKKNLTQAVKRLVRSGQLAQEMGYSSQSTQVPAIRLPAQRPDAIRTGGGRDLVEIPPLEVASVMLRTMDHFRIENLGEKEALYRKVLDFFDLKRLTPKARQYLGAVYKFHVLY